jgi:hypothetical protein
MSNKSKILSLTEMKEIIKNPNNLILPPDEELVNFGLHLNQFTQIEIDAAKLLIESQEKLEKKYEIKKLLLNGLVDISDELAGIINKWNSTVELNGLPLIKNNTAKLLAEGHLGAISLNGLQNLDGETAYEFIKNNGPLSFNGLTKLTDDFCKAFIKFKHGISLDGLKNLSSEQAKILVKNKESQYPLQLTLNGITSLDSQTATELAKFPGDLFFEGISNIKDDVAEALSKHKKMLVLSNLEKLSKKAKESLLKHKGTVVPDLSWF